jgi:hypothetical protein
MSVENFGSVTILAMLFLLDALSASSNELDWFVRWQIIIDDYNFIAMYNEAQKAYITGNKQLSFPDKLEQTGPARRRPANSDPGPVSPVRRSGQCQTDTN